MPFQIIISRTQIRSLESSPGVQREIQERAKRALETARREAPRDTGDLADSLFLVRTTSKGKSVVKLVSNDPQIRPILEGTNPPYSATPPTGFGSPLGGWARRHGFVTFPSRRRLARRIVMVGTQPAGTTTGNEDWLKNAIRSARR